MSRINVLLFEFLSLMNPSNYVPCKRDTPSTTYPPSKQREEIQSSFIVRGTRSFLRASCSPVRDHCHRGRDALAPGPVNQRQSRSQAWSWRDDRCEEDDSRREERIRFSAGGGRNRMERRESEIDNWIAAGRASKHASQGSVPSNVSAGSRDPYLIRAASALEPPLISSDTGRSPFFPSNPPSLGQVEAKNYPELPARIVFSIRRNFDKFRGQIPLIVE